MLKLSNITKIYNPGDTVVRALGGVNIEFRRSEFVAVLGPSGCGKTTLLNIVGGLDQYTDGDLLIDGRSTKEYKDGDWDVYRNRSVGFVFQTYNLIPHQTVLSNVELALTLSGVSKTERRRRAADALKKVGLGDQLKKKPNQMSGGQMQRVAIARALVNDPEILLADEPTGALDTETSTQIMAILKKIASDRLVVMVTHNSELADKYATRVVRLIDGRVISDSAPYRPTGLDAFKKDIDFLLEQKRRRKSRIKKKPMSMATAFALSLNNLMTKRARTFLTSFAGSIGIIGIALIMSISNGMNAYIDRMQQDTLSSYPISISKSNIDLGGMLSGMSGAGGGESDHPEDDKIYSANVLEKMLNKMMEGTTINNLSALKIFLESEGSGVKPLVNDIKYGYATKLYIFLSDTENGVAQSNPATVLEDAGLNQLARMKNSGMSALLGGSSDVWEELIGNEALLKSQYDVIAGKMPSTQNEVVLFIDDKNNISDYALYALGLKDTAELSDFAKTLLSGGKTELKGEQVSYTFDEILGRKYKLVSETAFYSKNADGVWVDRRKDAEFMKKLVDSSREIQIVGILRPNENAVATSAGGAIGYLKALMTDMIYAAENSAIVKEQKAKPSINIFTGLPFGEIAAQPSDNADNSSDVSDIALQFADATYDSILKKLGVSDESEPDSINIYAKDFDSKEAIIDIINGYNKTAEDNGRPEDAIQYTDIVGAMLSSVSTIVSAVSYVLIAFVAISLVVSSIMIGIITYISVLERTKEIGILRSIGASKKDISRVFNAETLFVGFVAGALGILITLLLCIPLSAIIKAMVNISGIAVLPVWGGIILILVSMALTFIAGLIPSRVASGKDPVEALRTE